MAVATNWNCAPRAPRAGASSSMRQIGSKADVVLHAIFRCACRGLCRELSSGEGLGAGRSPSFLSRSSIRLLPLTAGYHPSRRLGGKTIFTGVHQDSQNKCRDSPTGPHEKPTTQRFNNLSRTGTSSKRFHPRTDYRLRLGRHAGVAFRRQVPIGPYFADFLCCRARLVVEIDGESHLSEAQHDRARDCYMTGLGLFRFPVSRMTVALNEVVALIFDSALSRITQMNDRDRT